MRCHHCTKTKIILSCKYISGEKPGQYQDVLGHQLARLLPNGSLLIEAVAQEDEGHYMCEASNGIGVGLSAVVQLTVQGMQQLLNNCINIYCLGIWYL
jgi:hypothetical protein